MVRLHLGDCREVMPGFTSDTFTGIVTDPPYELGFMGKKWDKSGVAFEVDVWREALRVCRPGSPLFAFGGTRSYHRLACAIEDAGWIIRDSVQIMYGLEHSMDALAETLDPVQRGLLSVILEQFTGHRLHSWLYGSGMPKGQAIGKAMDRAAGAERTEVIGSKLGMPGKSKDFSNQAPSASAIYGGGDAPSPDITAPATPAAARWEGWNTGLAPAWEPIICAMKPLDGTFVENAQAHGVAGLNVDGSRTPTAAADAAAINAKGSGDGRQVSVLGEREGLDDISPVKSHDLGRWPANLLLDAAAAEMLDEAVGDLHPGGNLTGREPSPSTREVLGHRQGQRSAYSARDFETGGPSRYFPTVERFHYSGKANSKDRGHRVEKAAPLFDVHEDTEVRCKHPTVKPLSVCEWLVRLAMMPENTRILDLFAGTAQVGKACIRFGVDYDGVEIDPESHAWAEDQLRRAKR